MLYQVGKGRTYDPEIVAVMTAALEMAWQTVSQRMNGNDVVKQMLARTILTHVDRGERDARRLADSALCEWIMNGRPSDDRSIPGTRQSIN
jgi:hypothetical protein